MIPTRRVPGPVFPFSTYGGLPRGFWWQVATSFGAEVSERLVSQLSFPGLSVHTVDG